MKNILGHKSYTKDELIEILSNHGSYTCPTLPHYRYDRVKSICIDLMKRGFLKKSGKTNEGVNLVVTDRFIEWKTAYQNKETTKMPVKWQKEHYPLTNTPDKKKCLHCREEYKPSQANQKYCSKKCAKDFNLKKKGNLAKA